MTYYVSSADFRRALEDRLRSMSINANIPLVRLRKTVVFDRFLARLIKRVPEHWILKGGYGIQLRLMNKARTTKDIDVLFFSKPQDVLPILKNAGNIDLGDWFTFEIGNPTHQSDEIFGGLRFPIRALLDSRTFEEFHIDIGINNPVIESIDYINVPSLLDFAGFPPINVPCYPITQQIAEKIHAYTRPHVSGESSRVKDIVDILLIAGLHEIIADIMHQAINATFNSYNTHPIPLITPLPPLDWSKPFHKLAIEISLEPPLLSKATQSLKQFLDPLFNNTEIHYWDPIDWRWKYQ